MEIVSLAFSIKVTEVSIIKYFVSVSYNLKKKKKKKLLVGTPRTPFVDKFSKLI